MISAKIEKNAAGNWCFIYEFYNEIFDESPEKVMKDVGLEFFNLASMIYEDIQFRKGEHDETDKM